MQPLYLAIKIFFDLLRENSIEQLTDGYSIVRIAVCDKCRIRYLRLLKAKLYNHFMQCCRSWCRCPYDFANNTITRFRQRITLFVDKNIINTQ